MEYSLIKSPGLESEKKMLNWEELKDYSYINIKATKKPSFTLGIERCIDGKLCDNSLHEHVKEYMKIRRMKLKEKGSSLSQNHSTQSLPSKMPVQLETSRESPRKDYSCLSQQLRKSSRSSSNPELSYRKHVNNKIEMLKTIISRFDSTMNRTRRNFEKVKNMNKKLVGIDCCSDEEVLDSLMDNKFAKQLEQEEKQKKERERKELETRIKELQKPICFPFSSQTIKYIMLVDQIKAKKESRRAKRMISSLYTYKSKITQAIKTRIVHDSFV